MDKSRYLEIRSSVGFDAVAFGGMCVNLFTEYELDAAQVGYSVHPDGQSLTGVEVGDWMDTWLVIATEDQCGDPVFTDLAFDEMPVFTAVHGEGDWEPELIADSLAGFFAALEQVRAVSEGRETPVALAANPLPETVAQAAMEQLRRINPRSSTEFWSSWLRS